MVYRVLTPLGTAGGVHGVMGSWGHGSTTETFVWTQAQWVGVPLLAREGFGEVGYREGEASDTVDIAIDPSGSLTVAPQGAASNAPPGTNARAGASEIAGAPGRDARRGQQRSVRELRQEARRRLRQARRAGKNKRGGKTVASAPSPPQTFIKRSSTPGGPSATLVVQWRPDAVAQTTGCARGGNVAGSLTIELHLLKGSDIYQVWHVWTDLQEGSGHGGQRVRQNNWSPSWGTSPCAPTPGEGQSLVSFAGWMPSPGFHNGGWTMRARYGWVEFTPPYGYGTPQYGEASVTVNFNNLLLQPDLTNPVVLIWDPDDPTKRQTRVKMELTDAQVSAGVVQLKVYRLDDAAQSRQPLKVIEVPVTMPATLVEIEWDGSDEMGNVLAAGVYGYDLLAWDTVLGSGGDADVKSSNYLFIDAGLDEAGNPILEAEYAGYDDNGMVEDETDDNHLYYIRRYKLREVAVPLDNDGDVWENEDPVDGIDNDGDGLIDEDPEDYQPLRNASEGYIRLYDPDLQPVAQWSIPSLLCVDHNANDGLMTSTGGLQHSVLVKVPIALMEKAGEYRFVISAKDSHGDREKGHRQKPALERNQRTEMKKLALMVDPGHGRYYDKDAGLGVRTRGGQTVIDATTIYREADAVWVIADKVMTYLQGQTTKVRAVDRTRPTLWDIDENAMNAQVGCYGDDKINVGNETCRLGFRAFDERAKRTKNFSALHYNDEVVFVSMHTEPNRLATSPECRYVYDDRHEKLADCHSLGKAVVARLTKITQNAPTDRGAYEKSVQVLWFAGVDLTQTTFTSDAYYPAEQKKTTFSAFENSDPKKRIRVPAIIIECYSHAEVNWAQLLLTDSHRQALAEAVAKGTLDYHDAKLKKK